MVKYRKVKILDIIFLPKLQLRTLVDSEGNVTVCADGNAIVKHSTVSLNAHPNQAADLINAFLNSAFSAHPICSNPDFTLRAKIYEQIFTRIITPAEYVLELLNRTLFACDAFLSATFQVSRKLGFVEEA